ncbi:Golgi membrane exchange factor (Ric1p-Rgp1p) subunit [Lecanora helva]
MSDIRVSVQWKSSTVFAGEEIECTITFTNVSQVRKIRRSPSPNSQLRRNSSSRERWREALPLRSINPVQSSNHGVSTSARGVPMANSRAHKPALSLNAPNGFPPGPSLNASGSLTQKSSIGNNKHRRSVSIVSIGGDAIDEAALPGPMITSGRPIGGHVRAASLQVLPRRSPKVSSGPQSGHDRAFTVPSPLVRSTSSFAEQRGGTQAMGVLPSARTRNNRNSLTSFKFPQGSDSSDKNSERFSSPYAERPDGFRRALSPKPHRGITDNIPLSPATKILSPINFDDTPRSSGEFYSMSNNSTETLASEYTTRENSRLVNRPAHSRQGSFLAPTRASKPEVLMMGYAQIAGSYTLDGSLVNQNPFEGVKRKGIIGGQGGGGVVRSESTKRDSGILGSLSWGNIGDSIGGFLTNNEISSIKEDKKASDSRAIPILSTPQSILFVDLQLGPGESKSYSYRHPLPRGIPPSHKGRAIKIAYNLVVGTQRATQTTKRHQIQHADIPFKVLTGVNERGDILGHDLMSPHTILTDIASISHVAIAQVTQKADQESRTLQGPNADPTDFLSYVENLLHQPQSASAGLLSPTQPDPGNRIAIAEPSATMKDLVDLAILNSSATSSTKRSANRFEIARSGDRVAVIMLTRAAYRLGETVPVVIDFQTSDIPCHSLHASLETSEVIDPALALRSKASIHRVTRRIYASHFESTIGANKVTFSPMIPVTSTPDFVTSGVHLEWRLRFEFVTNRVGDIDEMDENVANLMEEVARDERGSVKAAVQGLTCESFDITVPLRVYGAIATIDETNEPDQLPI